MKVVNRAKFLEYPEGTLYSKGGKWWFNDILVKGESWHNPNPEALGDWVCLGMCWPSAEDSGEAIDILEKRLEDGKSFKSEEDWGRDGMFEPEDLFLIFEAEDLRKLERYVREALKVVYAP